MGERVENFTTSLKLIELDQKETSPALTDFWINVLKLDFENKV